MGDSEEGRTLADVIGPWVDPGFESRLIARCRVAWNKPIRELTNEELATMLRQGIGVEWILPVAKERLENGVDDDTETYDVELRSAAENAIKSIGA